MAQLIWSITGDTIPLDPVDCDVYNYFVAELGRNNLNRYTMPDLGAGSLCAELQTNVRLVNNLLQSKLRISAFDFDLDPTNQAHLNTLHRQWVKVHQQFPQISKLVDTQIPGVLDRINKVIHAIEDLTATFEITTEQPNYMIANPFGSEILRYGVYNVSISYHNLGSLSFEKWLHGDPVHDTDTNNFSEFYTTLKINVLPTINQSAPIEYQQWCKRYQMPCQGNRMPLANFDNLENNMLKYKQLFHKNSLVTNNFIILE
jgi:hypothetical protein